jgi:hypothetical protein
MTHPPAVKICPHHPTSMPRVHHQGMTWTWPNLGLFLGVYA